MKRFLSITFITTLIMTMFAAFAGAEEKAVSAKVSVDVGENIVKLVGSLAAQIGTTADKVFPWYAQQAVLSGYTALVSCIVCALIGVGMFASGLIMVDKNKTWRNSASVRCGSEVKEVVGCAIAIVGVVLFAVCAIYSCCGGLTNDVTRIFNPNYHAMKMLTEDMGKLVGK